MKFFKRQTEDGDLIAIPDIPKKETRQLFRVTISSIARIKSPKVETRYIDKDEGKLIHSWERKDDKEYEEVQYFQEEFNYSDQEEKVFSQELDTLNVADIALYINRAR